jgi:transcriptional regulator with XRE-family HTH domain
VSDELDGFGDRLRIARERLSLSQAQLGDAVGTDGNTVSRWELGKGFPQARQMAKLATTLNADLNHLLLGKKPNGAPQDMPPAFLDFLQTEYGKIAQKREYIEALLSVRVANPTVRLYSALVFELQLNDLEREREESARKPKK